MYRLELAEDLVWYQVTVNGVCYLSLDSQELIVKCAVLGQSLN